MTTNQQVNLPQLASGNFNNWKFRVSCLLEEKQLTDTLEKEENDFQLDAETRAFQQRDARAKSIIVQCITDKHLDLVKDARTAKRMMQILTDIFERKTIVSKLILKKRLLTLKLQRGIKLEDHFLTVDSTIRELENAGSKMDESDKVCHLLLTLSEEYKSVITAIETINTDVTMEFVKSRLLDEESKLRAKGNHREHGEEVSFKALPIVCYKCGKEGHKSFDCYKFKMTATNFRDGKLSKRTRGTKFRGNSRSISETANRADNAKENEIAFAIINDYTVSDNMNIFILDSGATKHLVSSDMEKYMQNIQILDQEANIKVADGGVMKAKKKGLIKGTCQNQEIVFEALIVDGMDQNLLSVAQLTKKGNTVLFGINKVLIKNEKYTFKCKEVNRLFVLEINLKTAEEQCNSAILTKNIWHRRLGHLNRNGLTLLGLPCSKEKCDSCIRGKSTRKPFHIQPKRSKQIGDLIHTDIAGPITPETYTGEKYFQVLIDDYSHFTIVKLLNAKDEAAQNVIDFIELIKTQKNKKTRRIRCDNAKEFKSSTLQGYCKSKGIEIEYTNVYTPQQNGTAERMNRTLLDKVRTKLIESKVPKELWGEALRCSAYELNRSPTAANNGIPPAKLWYGINNLSKLRVFGCVAWAVKLPRGNKLDARAEALTMIGYQGAGYRLWDANENKCVCSRDVMFNEDQMAHEAKDTRVLLEEPSNKEDVEDKQRDVTINKEDDEDTDNKQMDLVTEQSTTTRTGRKVKTPKHLNEYEIYHTYCLFAGDKDPESYEKAVNDEGWKAAIEKELNTHRELNTWIASNLPSGKKAIDTKWVFRTKEDGTKKARIVARGFQMEEENYLNSWYAPVARMSSIRIMLICALENNWPVRQLDIPAAFLNGTLNTEVYIKPPKGLEVKSEVLKLNKALYGLRESPQVWNTSFNTFAIKNNFVRSKYDCCLYYNNNNVWMIVYVDDILITGNEREVQSLISLLQVEFKVKDLGDVQRFLGMEIKREKETYKITQTQLIDKVLRVFEMEECRGINTPMEVGFNIEEEEQNDYVPYRRLIGSLMYVAITTRPDIMYAVSYLSRALDRPTNQTWKAAKRVLRYLKQTKLIGLIYKKGNKKIEAYTDADWASDKKDRKSVSGGIISYSNNTITWHSKKQNCIALSSAEAELIAATVIAQDMISVKGVISNFKMNTEAKLYCDNKSAIFMSKNHENSKRSKHVDIRIHFLKDLIEKKIIEIDYVSSDENIADILTKALCKVKLVKLRTKSGLIE